MYAIARMQKHNSLADVQIAGAHNARTSPRFAKNVDHSRTHLNQILVGSNRPLDDIKALLPTKRRKDAVVAVEILLTASPDFFRSSGQGYGEFDMEITEKWKKEALAWAKDYYGKNLVNCALHLDEKTPHLQMFVVPLTADGRLSAKEMFNRKNLQNYQTSYASAMKGFGLERGVSAEVTGRHHDPLANYYKNGKRVTARLQEIEIPEIKKNLFGTVSAEDAQKAVMQVAQEAKKREAELLTALKATEKELASAERVKDEVIKKSEKLSAENKQLLDQQRKLPMSDVMRAYGYEKTDKGYDTPAGYLVQDGKDFRMNGKLIKNAIDVIMIVKDCSAIEACKDLVNVYDAQTLRANYVDHVHSSIEKSFEKRLVEAEKPLINTYDANQSAIETVSKVLNVAVDDIKKSESMMSAIKADKHGNAILRVGDRAEIIHKHSMQSKILTAKSAMIGEFGKMMAYVDTIADAIKISLKNAGVFSGFLVAPDKTSQKEQALRLANYGQKVEQVVDFSSKENDNPFQAAYVRDYFVEQQQKHSRGMDM